MQDQLDLPPYNYCDYRCEKCELTEECRVYQKEKERRLKHLTEGKDPDAIHVVMEDVKTEFEETLKLLRQQAEEMGIDLDEVSKEEIEEPPPPETFPLYRLAREFTDKAFQFLKEHEEEDFITEEELGDLAWHHSVVSVKLARALESKWEGDEFGMEDAERSAGVALKSIRCCHSVLATILERYPRLFDAITGLLILAKKIEQGILDEFSTRPDEPHL